MFIIFYCLWVAGSQGLRVFLTLCLCVFVSLRLCDFTSLWLCDFATLRLCDFATLRLCDLFDCKNITKNISRQTDNFDMIIDVVDERWRWHWHWLFETFFYFHRCNVLRLYLLSHWPTDLLTFSLSLHNL